MIYVPDTVGDGAFVVTAFDLTAKAKRAFRRRQPTSLANPLAIKLDHCPSAWRSSSGDGISPFQVTQKTSALKYAKMMCSREPLREHQIYPFEGFGPEHDAAQDQERSSHGTREQDPRDAGDDQQGTDLLGDGPTVGDLSGAVHGHNGRRRLTDATGRVYVVFR